GTDRPTELARAAVGAFGLSFDGATLHGSGSRVHVGGPEFRGRVAWTPHPLWGRCLGFAPDGRTVACLGDDDILRLWDVTGTRPNAKAVLGNIGDVFPGEMPRKKLPFEYPVLTFPPDGKVLALGTYSGALHVWWLERTPPRQWRFQPQEPPIPGRIPRAFSPDGKRLVTVEDTGGRL